jgi:hypothetical protein
VVPHRRQVLAHSQHPLARLVAARDPTARQRGEVGCHLRAMGEGVVPAPVSCSRHQTVVRIDPSIVPSGPLDLRPRLLHGACSGLPWRVRGRLDALERRARRLDPRGLEGLKHGGCHGRIDTQPTARHACRGAPVDSAAPADIPWPAARGAALDDLELAAAAPTPQPAPAPRWPPCGRSTGGVLWHRAMGLQARWVMEQHVPTDGARRLLSHDHPPRLQGLLLACALPGTPLFEHGRGLRAPIDAGPSIARMGPPLVKTRPPGAWPAASVARRPGVDLGPRQPRSAVPQPGLPGAPEVVTLLAHPVQRVLHLTVGKLFKAMVRGTDTAHRHVPHDTAAADVLCEGCPRPLTHPAPRRFGQRALPAEYEAVVELAGSIHPIILPQPGRSQGPELAQLMPVPVVPRHAGRCQGHDDSDTPLTHGGQELSEARTRLAPWTPAASVRIDDDALPTAQGAGAVRSGILTPWTLVVVADVMGAGLAHLDVSGAVQLRRTTLLTQGYAPGSVRRAPEPCEAGPCGRDTAGVVARGAAARREDGLRTAPPEAGGGGEGSWASRTPVRCHAQDVAGAVGCSKRA